MAITLAALKAELQNDPTARGYAAPLAEGNYQAVVDLLNALRDGATVGRSLVPAWQFVNCIVPSEYAALTVPQRDYLTMVAAAGDVQLGGGAVRDALTAIFAGGTTTRTNLVALLNRPATRAEELFGDGVTIQPEHITYALRVV
jgi:hypothetical protein